MSTMTYIYIFPENRARYVYPIPADGALILSRVCFDFLIQVLKQKSAHLFFLLGWSMRFLQGSP